VPMSPKRIDVMYPSSIYFDVKKCLSNEGPSIPKGSLHPILSGGYQSLVTQGQFSIKSCSSNSSDNHLSNHSIRCDYLLRYKVKSRPLGSSIGGLALEKSSIGQVGRKSHFTLAQIQVKKDIRNGNKKTIVWAIRARIAHVGFPQ
jgi:hypothetical protein